MGGVIVLLLIIIGAMGYVIVKKTSLIDKYYEYKRGKDNYAPYDKEVNIENSILPVVRINTDNIERDVFIPASVTISNGDFVDFDGEMNIRYRGHSSFTYSKKKSYALRPLDENGSKQNVSLLGMKKSKKWALKGNWIDRSMIREAIAYQLAKNTEVWTPDFRFCELVLNDTYYGLYTLMEQPTRKNLDICKMKDDISGGYLLYFSRVKEADFIVDYSNSSTTVKYPFIVKYPNIQKFNSENESYLQQRIKLMCDAINDTTSRAYEEYIDVMSFIDYQISSEFACNTDAYWGSGFIYKDNDNIDGRFKVCLWDGDHAFGMGKEPKYSWYNHWIYNFYEGQDLDHIYDWWNILMKNPNYRKALQDRWIELRRGCYSDENIEQIVDSLSNLLISSGAMERNNKAWRVWNPNGSNKNQTDLKYYSDSFEDEVRYIKDWIRLRVEWMDDNIIKEK